ncbi:MAG: bifunctional ADP-heptose synthase, partial [Pseudomonadota bacterium]|nr:bifunctional ADP-heptose synthase [Pseudomonadota bacterium]
DAGQKQPLLDLLDRVEGLRVLVVGETVLDEYRYVQPMNKTPKENLVATLYNSAEVFAGGAVATANHVAALCREVDLLTLVGHDAEGASVQQRVKDNVTVYPVERAMAPTVRKVRYVDSNQMRKMFEVYHMDDQPLAAGTQAKVDDFIRAKAADYDLVIVNDFGHGMIAASTVAALTEASRFLAVNTQTNSGNFGFNLVSKFTGADYVCIDTPEARLATGQKYGAVDSLLTRHLAEMMPTAKIVITQGRDGCLAYAAGAAPHQVPALADKVVDTVGAGDAFLAITAPLVAAGGDMRQVGFLGNVAGALKVGIVGHRQSIDKVAFIKAVVAMLK